MIDLRQVIDFWGISVVNFELFPIILFPERLSLCLYLQLPLIMIKLDWLILTPLLTKHPPPLPHQHIHLTLQPFQPPAKHLLLIPQLLLILPGNRLKFLLQIFILLT